MKKIITTFKNGKNKNTPLQNGIPQKIKLEE